MGGGVTGRMVRDEMESKYIFVGKWQETFLTPSCQPLRDQLSPCFILSAPYKFRCNMGGYHQWHTPTLRQPWFATQRVYGPRKTTGNTNSSHELSYRFPHTKGGHEPATTRYQKKPFDKQIGASMIEVRAVLGPHMHVQQPPWSLTSLRSSKYLKAREINPSCIYHVSCRTTFLTFCSIVEDQPRLLYLQWLEQSRNVSAIQVHFVRLVAYHYAGLLGSRRSPTRRSSRAVQSKLYGDLTIVNRPVMVSLKMPTVQDEGEKVRVRTDSTEPFYVILWLEFVSSASKSKSPHLP